MKHMKLKLLATLLFTAGGAQATVIQCDPNATGSAAYPNVTCDSSGNLNVNVVSAGSSVTTVQGKDATASATTAKPVLVGGSNGTNTYQFKVDTSGQLYVNVVGTVPVSGTFWQATQPVSLASLPSLATGTNSIGTVGLNTGSNTIGAVNVNGTVPVSGTFWQTTQPVSLTSLPALATGTNTIGAVNNNPLQYTATDCSGTITTGGTSQTALASNTSRHAFYIQNTSTANEAINFTSAASLTSGSIILTPNSMFQQESITVSSDAITIIGASTGQAFVCKSF